MKRPILQGARDWVSRMAGKGAALWRRFDAYPLLQFLFLALLINLTVEVLSRHSLLGALGYLFTSPLYFLFSTLIILATLSFSLLFRKRTFFLCFVCLVWLGLGIANCIILTFRTIPLGASDFALLSSVFSVFSAYLNPVQMVLIVMMFLAAFAFLILLWRVSHRRAVRYPSALLTVCLLCAAVYGTTSALQSTPASSSAYLNISAAYENFGFVYCFSNSVVDRGIQEPEDYSQEAVDQVLSTIAPQEEESEEEELPNVIFVQLESFFDVNRLKGVTFSENPLPTLTALREEYAHGLLEVPFLGSGTANTEFEVLTGMSLDYFGSCEYPYMTILQDVACETIATNLSQMGLDTHAIHNNTATFYQRDTVYGALGLRTFTTLEYMNNVEYTPLGWAKDSALVAPILDALDSGPQRDFIFTVSVQPHGKYPTTPPADGADSPIIAEGCETPEAKTAMEYYVAQLRETDAFVAELIEVLSQREEDTVVVFYGDHLPELNVRTEDLSVGSCYQTEYVIWSNFPLPAEERDLSTYQLSAYVLDLIGVHTGVINQLHQHYDYPPESPEHDDAYQSALRLLSYDMLYGERYFCSGGTPYVITPVQLGVKAITVTGTEESVDGLLVHGENFTPFSRVVLGDHRSECTFLSPQCILVSWDQVPDEENLLLSVCQLSKSGTEVLSTSNTISFSYDPQFWK